MRAQNATEMDMNQALCVLRQRGSHRKDVECITLFMIIYVIYILYITHIYIYIYIMYVLYL